MSSNSKNELREDLINLYAQGKKFDYGSLVYKYKTASADQNLAVATLGKQYANDMEIHSLGFNYGYASFLDCIIGEAECYREPQKEAEFPAQVCLFILFCHYKNIFVLGEHTYFDKDSFILPAFHAVDNFTTNRTSSLATGVHKLLDGGEYQRVYAADLDGQIPDSIKNESNLVGEYPFVFDGYFNWTD